MLKSGPFPKPWFNTHTSSTFCTYKLRMSAIVNRFGQCSRTFFFFFSSCRVISNRNEGGVREPLQHFGGPPPLISPKPQQQPTPTSLWNPVSMMDTTTEPRRTQEPTTVHNHHAAAMYEHTRQTVASIKIERPFCYEKQQDEEELAHRRREMEKYQPIRDSSTLEHSGYSHAPFLAELEKSTQTFLNQQRSSLQQAGQTMEITLLHKPITALRAPPPRTREPMYIYDEFLQQHRRLVSKLDLEERRRKEAREKGKMPMSCRDLLNFGSFFFFFSH